MGVVKIEVWIKQKLWEGWGGRVGPRRGEGGGEGGGNFFFGGGGIP